MVAGSRLQVAGAGWGGMEFAGSKLQVAGFSGRGSVGSGVVVIGSGAKFFWFEML